MSLAVKIFFSCSVLILSTAFSFSSLPRHYTLSKPCFAVKNSPPTAAVETSGLSEEREDDLDNLLSETLFRMSFFMETDYLERVETEKLRNLFRTCREVCEIKDSTIPQAGRGLFASQDIPKHTIVAFYPVHCVGFKFPSGICQSVQAAAMEGDQIMIDHEKS